MYRFIFGFQRLVGGAIGTPAARSCLSVSSGMRKTDLPVSTSASVFRSPDLWQATRRRQETCLFARQSIAAHPEFETGGYAAGIVGFFARGPRGARVRAARSGLQVG